MYPIGYYPKNQQFDADWRAVRVKVNKRGFRLRTGVLRLVGGRNGRIGLTGVLCRRIAPDQLE